MSSECRSCQRECAGEFCDKTCRQLYTVMRPKIGRPLRSTAKLVRVYSNITPEAYRELVARAAGRSLSRVIAGIVEREMKT